MDSYTSEDDFDTPSIERVKEKLLAKEKSTLLPLTRAIEKNEFTYSKSPPKKKKRVKRAYPSLHGFFGSFCNFHLKKNKFKKVTDTYIIHFHSQQKSFSCSQTKQKVIFRSVVNLSALDKGSNVVRNRIDFHTSDLCLQDRNLMEYEPPCIDYQSPLTRHPLLAEKLKANFSDERFNQATVIKKYSSKMEKNTDMNNICRIQNHETPCQEHYNFPSIVGSMILNSRSPYMRNTKKKLKSRRSKFNGKLNSTSQLIVSDKNTPTIRRGFKLNDKFLSEFQPKLEFLFQITDNNLNTFVLN